MRFLLLSDASSYHTHRWAESIGAEGHEVVVASMEPSIRDGTIVIRSPLWKFKYVASVPRFKRLAEELEPDVVFAHFLPNYGLIGSFLRAPVRILALWGSDILHWAFKTPLHRKLARRIIHAYDRVIADARFVKEVVAREFGYPEDRIDVIPFGVRREVRERPMRELPARPLHFVSLRRHEPLFNHPEVLRFLKLLSRDLPLRITFLQRGSMTEELRELARDMGLKVEFTGSLPYDDYLRVLESAHFCVSVPDRDASSVSLLECMALGGVPIVSDIPANREWVGEGTGIITPPIAEEMYRRFRRTYTREWWRRARSLNRATIAERCNWEANLRALLSRISSYL